MVQIQEGGQIMKYNIFFEKSDFIPNTSSLLLDDLFSKSIIDQIELLKKGEIDHLLIRGIKISNNLPKTPQEIRDMVEVKENNIINSVANYLGNISKKGIENSIRFDIDGNNNTETWHNHRQYKYSVFLCLKDDPKTQSFLLSANNLIKESNSEIKNSLLNKLTYLENESPFSLIENNKGKYSFSYNIFYKSDLEDKIKDLDLPDALQKLERIKTFNHDLEVQKAISYLIRTIKNFSEHYTFTKGDLMIVDEASTIRFSPEYTPTKINKGDERWILSVSVDH